MGWQNFIAEMTGHLVWPVAVVVVLLIFRKPLRARISQLRSVSAGSFGAEFGEADRQVGEAVATEAARSAGTGLAPLPRVGARPDAEPLPESVPEPVERGAAGPPLPRVPGRTGTTNGVAGRRPSAALDLGFREIALRAEQNPAYAVDAAWSALEDAMAGALDDVRSTDVLDRAGRVLPRQGATMARALLDSEVISPVTYQAIISLGRLRDQVTHGAMSPQPGAAVGYVRSVNDIARAVRTGVATVQQDQQWGVT